MGILDKLKSIIQKPEVKIIPPTKKKYVAKMVAFTAEQRKVVEVVEELQARIEARLGVKVSASQAITIAASEYIRNARLLIRGMK